MNHGRADRGEMLTSSDDDQQLDQREAAGVGKPARRAARMGDRMPCACMRGLAQMAGPRRGWEPPAA